MRKHLLDLVLLGVLATIVLGLLALAKPGERTVAVHVYVLVIGGLVMLALVAGADDAVTRRHRSSFDAALAEAAHERDVTPAGLERMEREVALASASSFDLHFRLIPHLREIAEARLERAGKRASPETLGRWWELLDPNRPAPDDRFAPGIAESDLRALVADLEELH